MPVRPGAPAVAADCPVTGIMVGTPMFGGQCYDAYLHGMLDLRAECAARGLPFGCVTLRNESDIKRARNRVMAEFLASSYSHLVFIDADIGFEARDVLRLVAHNFDYVGATYAKKNRARTDFAVVPLMEARRLRSGLIEVAALPGGFFCITRDLAMRMFQGYADRRYMLSPPERKGEPWEMWLSDLFGSIIDPETREYWTEDYAFSRRWRELGESVWLDPHIVLEHSGTSVFTGDPTEMFVPARKPAEPPAGNVIVLNDQPDFTERQILDAMADGHQAATVA